VKRIFSILSLWLSLSAIADTTPSYLTFPSNIDWVVKETEHFQVLYRRGQNAFAERALKAGEKAYRKLSAIFPPGPPQTWIVLADFQDSTNGYGITFPYPHMVIFASPPDAAGQLASLDDWLESVILHEYVHILHLYPVGGLWKPMRTVFGSWVVPNGLMPSHFHEGLAVLLETEKTKGGRGRSATFNAWKRMAVEAKVWGTDDFFSRDQLDGGVSRFPNGTTAYFFGYEFYKDLWARKGPEGIKAFVESTSSNWPYLLNGPLEEVYGKDSPTLWKEIFDKTRKETEKEIAEIKKSPLSSLKTLTQSKFLKWDLVYSPDETQFAYRRWNPEDGSAIDIVKIGSEAPIKTVETSGQNEGLCWGKVKDKNWLLVVDTQNSNLYQTNYLKAVELQTDKSFTLAAPNHSLSHVLRLNCDKSLTTLLVYQEADASVAWSAPVATSSVASRQSICAADVARDVTTAGPSPTSSKRYRFGSSSAKSVRYGLPGYTTGAPRRSHACPR
jgi:hypothetical protein